MTIDELIAKLEAIRDEAAAAMPACAMAMSDTYKEHLTRVTLQRSIASTWPGPPGKGQFGSPAPAGSPIAYRFGNLSRSVTSWPGGSSGYSAFAHVAPHVVYAGVQEYGAVIDAHRPYMRWYNSRGWWALKRVKVPPRPYLRPALDDVSADGSLERAAGEKFASLTGL